MSRRIEPSRKRPLEILADILNGHREAVISGPAHGRKYLDRVISENKSLPNASKFFLYDLLAEDCSQEGNAERRDEAAKTALGYMENAQEDAAREFKDYLPAIRCFELGITAAVDAGEFDEALALCERALQLGLGKAYEAKAHSIRRMI